MRKHLTPGVVLGAIAIVLAMSGSAVATSLITSAKIKDGTIQNKDIKKGTIALDRLTSATQKAVKLAGTPGPAGAKGANGTNGTNGTNGADGAPGTTLQASPGPTSLANWGLLNRNTIGSASAVLRDGPLKPPYGTGSLNLHGRRGQRQGGVRRRLRRGRRRPAAQRQAGRLQRLHHRREQRTRRRAEHAEHHLRDRSELGRQARRELRLAGLHPGRSTRRRTRGARTSTPPGPAPGA